ncbi:hypothetical protein TOPH_07550, partial [Tolypocladium ophioglossoides CBS 100239]
RLIDNHLLIDPAPAIYPDRSALRRQIRGPISTPPEIFHRKGHTILMTACLAENDADVNVFQEYLGMAVLEQRVASPERRERTKTKLTDVGAIRELVSEHRLLRLSQSDVELATLVAETLDVSGTVEEAVSRPLHIAV